MDDKDFSLFEADSTKQPEKKKSADEIMAALGRDDPPESKTKKPQNPAFSDSFSRVSALIGALSFVFTAGCGTMLFYNVVAFFSDTSAIAQIKLPAVGVLAGIIIAVAGTGMNTAVIIKNRKSNLRDNIICAVISLVSAVSGIITLTNVLRLLQILKNLAASK